MIKSCSVCHLLVSVVQLHRIPYDSTGVHGVFVKLLTDYIDRGSTYKDPRVNDAICRQYVDDMLSIGEKILIKDDNSYTASTDMGDIASLLLTSPLWN